MEFSMEHIILLVFGIVFMTSVSNCQTPDPEATQPFYTPEHAETRFSVEQLKKMFIGEAEPILESAPCKPRSPCGFQLHDEDGEPNYPYIKYCTCPEDFECVQYGQRCGYYYYKCKSTTESFLAALQELVESSPVPAGTETSEEATTPMQPVSEAHEDKTGESHPTQSISEEHWEAITHSSVADGQAGDKLAHLSVAVEQGDGSVLASVGEEQDYDYAFDSEESEELSHFDLLETVMDSLSEEVKKNHRKVPESKPQSENGIDVDKSKLSSLLQPTAQEGKEQFASEVHSEL